MGIERQAQLMHWNYFLALEEDLERLSRFVDFAGNENTYSIEIARLLMSASSECDVILRELCKKANPQSKAGNIMEYFPAIKEHYQGVFNYNVAIPRFGLTLRPWSDWTDEQSPLWWRAHNNVKHNRNEHFSSATLKHCINSMGALFLLVLHLYSDGNHQVEFKQIPRLIGLPDRFGALGVDEHGLNFSYNLKK